MVTDALRVVDRSRAGWWALTLALFAVVAYALSTLLGTVALAIFVYYATRPLYRRLTVVFDSRGLAAGVTLFAIALPVLLVAGYVAATGLYEVSTNLQAYADLLRPYVDVSRLQRPREVVTSLLSQGGGGQTYQRLFTIGLGVLALLATGLLHVSMALLAGFYLLRDGDRLSGWFEGLVGDAAYAYATAVDRDLETLYFGYLLLVFAVAAMAAVVYHAFNLVAPAALGVPMPTFLALLTGLTSLVPIVVSKIVYVPATLYVGVQAVRTDASLAFPVGLALVSLALLDLFPQMLLLPKIAGRELHVGLVMFSFIVGSVVFGWYGLFFGPFVVVLLIHVVRIGFTELVHGDPVTPRVTAGESLGSDPKAAESRDADDAGESPASDGEGTNA